MKLLEESGWSVLRLWESDIQANAPAEAEKVDDALRRLGAAI